MQYKCLTVWQDRRMVTKKDLGEFNSLEDVIQEEKRLFIEILNRRTRDIILKRIERIRKIKKIFQETIPFTDRLETH